MLRNNLLQELAANYDALTLTGTLPAHSRIFQRVADAQKCIIMSRSVGTVVTGLLEEGYATKGFHIKAKSCDWGPMAGFVLSDARLGKNSRTASDRESQQSDINKALAYGASEIEIYITARRIKELKNRGIIRQISPSNQEDSIYFTAENRYGRSATFLLKKFIGNRNTKSIWQVNMAALGTYPRRNENGLLQYKELNYHPVKALVDAHINSGIRKTYLSATTGDYDLFAIFHALEKYGTDFQSERREVSRMVPDSNRVKKPIGDYIALEDPHRGNLSNLINTIINDINREASYPGGNIVHHSDEAGRPNVDHLELPAIGWIPGKTSPYGIREKRDFLNFIHAIEGEYQYISNLNPGWFGDLGFRERGIVIKEKDSKHYFDYEPPPPRRSFP